MVRTKSRLAQETAKIHPEVSKGGALLAQGTGRRKKAIARVCLRQGTGQFMVNGRPADKYFDTEVTFLDANTVFHVLPIVSNYDISANVSGGGVSAQAGAVKLSIARALVKIDEELKPVLRKNGLLTCDGRNKERKKYGQKAARRKFQFVKR